MVNGKEGTPLPSELNTEQQKLPTALTEPSESEPLPVLQPEITRQPEGLPIDLSEPEPAPSAAVKTEEFKPPERLSFRELIRLSKDSEQANEYFKSVLHAEHNEGRLTDAQYKRFTEELAFFDPKKLIQDLLAGTSLNLGTAIGFNIGGASLLRDFYSTIGSIVRARGLPYLIQQILRTAGPMAAIPFIADPCGLIRAPYLVARSFQELKKINGTAGSKETLKSIPFFLGLNLLNFVHYIGPLTSYFLSYKTNGDLCLALLNHRIQTGKSPKFWKRFVNWTAQKLYKKPH